MQQQIVGAKTTRKDAWLKVTGTAKYNDDTLSSSCLQARLLTSVHAHARIIAIDVTEALALPGVRSVVTGADCQVLTGSILQDMPILATDVTRYFGEPVAIVVADEEYQAAQATRLIRVTYEPLPIINSVKEALKSDAELIHPQLSKYTHTVSDVYPEAGTNIANHTQIRKGNMEQGWLMSQIVIEAEYEIPQANHAYMETRNARVEILPGGQIHIYTSSQAPHASRALIAKYFKLNENDLMIHTPFVGGGFGGKVNPQPEMMAYLASKSVGGQEVRISLTREENFYASACKIGVTAKIKLGADKTGKIQAIKVDYAVDAGAYTDSAPVMSRAIAVNCSGAYDVPNIYCDSRCLYTNHVYTTSFRGFGHEVSTFTIERTIDKLADALHVDPLQIRMINALQEGSYTATQEEVTLSNAGNVKACIARLKELIEWDKGIFLHVSDNLIRAKGLACFCKTSSSPTDAASSAIVTFCSDGSVNLSCSVVECGPGMTTSLPQILADRLKMDINKISMNMIVNTHDHPEHWKTVASMSLYMAGSAILAAADDAIQQIKANAALLLGCTAEELEFANEQIYMKKHPAQTIKLKKVVFGVKYPNGNAVSGPVIGRGHFIMPDLSVIDTETGKGRPGPYYTVGAQAVEVEYDLSEYSYRLVKAVTVVDAGKVINPRCAAGQILGGMNTGLSLATREINHYRQNGELVDSSFRTYKMMHFAENPTYLVDFIETPNIGGPLGARGLGEHGVLGVPAAFSNALSRAADAQLDKLPITFESLWQKVNDGGEYAGI